MADEASNQQTTALFLSTIVTRTRRHTELTKKLTNLMGKLCCAREHSVHFFVQFFFNTAKLHSLTGALKTQPAGYFETSVNIYLRAISIFKNTYQTYRQQILPVRTLRRCCACAGRLTQTYGRRHS